MTNDFLEVKRGDAITADLWNRMEKASLRSRVLLGGENMRVDQFPHGALLSAKHGGGWDHPWRVIISSAAAMVSPGTVNGEKPTIKDKAGHQQLMTNRPPPLIALSHSLFDSHGNGWIALELLLDKNYNAIKTAEVKQTMTITGAELTTDNPFFFFGLPGIAGFKARYPLAKLKRLPGGGMQVYQIAMFNVNHKAKPPQEGQTSLARHFFWPA